MYRVKPKTQWKGIPTGILEDFVLADVEGDNDEEGNAGGSVKFPEGFDGIDELADYELIGQPCEVIPVAEDSSSSEDGDGQRRQKGKKRKRRRRSIELDDGPEAADSQEAEDDADNDGVARDINERSKRMKSDVPERYEAQEMPRKTSKKRITKKQKSKERNRKPAYDSMKTSTSDAAVDRKSDMSAWDELYVPDAVLRALADLGYDQPTEIQALCLPSAIRDRMDILGAAETGSGKTLAFGIPIIKHILSDKEAEEEDVEGDQQEPEPTSKKRNSKLRCLIVTPTRELAIQVKNHLVAIAKYTDIKITVIVGGMSQEKQLRVLKRCPEIVVGTPGRLWELVHEGQNHLSKASSINYLVIDEADRMLEKGHFEELSRLLAHINFDGVKKEARQTFVFSATLTLIHDAPKRIVMNKKKQKLTEKTKLDKLMAAIGVKEKPKVVDITRKVGTAETLQEGRINCKLEEKDAYLYYILSQHPGRTLVFCNSVDCVRRLTTVMTVLKRTPMPLHAAMHQKQRLKNLERFTASANGLLIATDVAQRGLDVPNVEHVIHYQVPRTSEAYVHRSGRTARASKEGVSIMLVDPDEAISYRRICRTLERENDLPIFPVNPSILKEVKQRVKLAQKLDQLEHRHRRLNSQNNWFKKAAMDMDIELDEDNLLNNMGDKSEQADYRRQVTSMQQQLDALLRKPILSEKIVGRYPSFGANLDSVLLRATSSGKDNALAILKNDQKRTKQTKQFKSVTNLGSRFNKSKAKFKSKQRKKKPKNKSL